MVSRLVSGSMECLQAVNFVGNNIVVMSQTVNKTLFLKGYKIEEDLLLLEAYPDENLIR